MKEVFTLEIHSVVQTIPLRKPTPYTQYPLLLGYHVNPLPKKRGIYHEKPIGFPKKYQLKKGRVFGGYGGRYLEWGDHLQCKPPIPFGEYFFGRFLRLKQVRGKRIQFSLATCWSHFPS